MDQRFGPTDRQRSRFQDARAEGGQVQVLRVLAPGGRLIRKTAVGPSGRRALRREREILHRLAGVAGVTQQLASAPTEPDVLQLREVPGTRLADLVVPMAPAPLLRLARDLAGVLAEVHARGVTHRAICPANVVISGDGSPVLVDFSRATLVAEIDPEFVHHTRIDGALPYLAPEETGRTGRPVDQRADLYALGTVLYQLATGSPPFGSVDPLSLVHDHLARVPVPPVVVNPQVPPVLSQIIMRLLEKEPDRRYQSASGLLYDLTRLAEGSAVAVGAHDVPPHLRPPSRLVGRDREIAILNELFASAISDGGRSLLLSGPAGVGKTALAGELRPIATANDGWYVAGKFDKYRRDHDYDGVRQAFRNLVRLLLAEPEEVLAPIRRRIHERVGANVGLAAAVLPEVATLLRIEPDPGVSDPQTDQARVQRTATDLLRAVACPTRPVVMLVDDLQWAPRTPLGVIDQILSGESIDGLLLVCSYRDDEMGPVHPLTPMLERWHASPGVTHLHLTNLNPSGQAALIADILRTDPDRTAELAAAIEQHTRGNPYDTIELLNLLHHDGVLELTAEGWRWDPDSLRQRLGSGQAASEMLISRIRSLPAPARELLEVMSCLGDRVEMSTLPTATGMSPATVEDRLRPALRSGLLVLKDDQDIGFRHDRVREETLRCLGDREPAVRLRLARALAAAPDLYAAAAQQYLHVVDRVTTPREQRTVASLFRRAAASAKLLSNHSMMERLLTAAVPFLDPRDTGALVEVHTGRHLALSGLGRLDEANEVYDTIVALAPDPLARSDATVVQMGSLTNQGRSSEALELGRGLLRELGVAVPDPQQLPSEVDRGLEVVYRWVATPADEDLRQPELADPTELAAAALINRALVSAYITGDIYYGWYALTALRYWLERGHGSTLVGPIGRVPGVLIATRNDYRTGRAVALRTMAVSRARGYEPATSRAEFLYAYNCGHWFESLEDNVARTRRAREGLIRGGDLQDACWTYYVSVPQSLEFLPTLDGYLQEVDAALAFADRIGNDFVADFFRVYRHLADVLRGQAGDEEASLAVGPASAAHLHLTQALAAAILDDPPALERHTAAAIDARRFFTWLYSAVVLHLLRALALAAQVRAAQSPPAVRARAHDELDRVVDWLAARAEDAPGNVLHLLRLAEAERAWADGDFQTAALNYDAAVRQVAHCQRPWHDALIRERAGRFYLAHGAEHAGQLFMAEARQRYQAWGASAKVSRLDLAYGDLPAVGGVTRRARPDTAGDTLDLLSVLAASRALSSQATIGGLHTQLRDILTTMTGATGVHLLVRGGPGQGWLLASDSSDPPRPLDPTSPVLPMSAVSYAERTGRPLVVADATRDDRVAHDPYLADLDRCALLVMPVAYRGRIVAMLVLENRLIRGAFTTDRLEAVALVSGQLAVSLENVQLYSSLERRVAERTAQLAQANRRLEELSATDPLTGLPNRRRLQQALDEEWALAAQQRRPLSLAMIDIDHFKRYNDLYGHAAGDQLLRILAAALRRTSGRGDLVARYGGEEFAVVMPGSDLPAALSTARHMHEAVAAPAVTGDVTAPADRPAGEGATEPDARGGVTLSIGVATVAPAGGGSPDHLIRSADIELYRAKRQGRNRISPAEA